MLLGERTVLPEFPVGWEVGWVAIDEVLGGTTEPVRVLERPAQQGGTAALSAADDVGPLRREHERSACRLPGSGDNRFRCRGTIRWLPTRYRHHEVEAPKRERPTGNA